MEHGFNFSDEPQEILRNSQEATYVIWNVVDSYDKFQIAMSLFLHGLIDYTPWHNSKLDDETQTDVIKDAVVKLTLMGCVTIESQPNIEYFHDGKYTNKNLM